MRAFVVTGPGRCEVAEVEDPRPSPGQVLKDLTTVGILGASAGLAATIGRYAAGSVDPRPLVAATVGLGEVGAVLAGWRPAGSGPGPKVHVDPRA